MALGDEPQPAAVGVKGTKAAGTNVAASTVDLMLGIAAGEPGAGGGGMCRWTEEDRCSSLHVQERLPLLQLQHQQQAAPVQQQRRLSSCWAAQVQRTCSVFAGIQTPRLCLVVVDVCVDCIIIAAAAVCI